MAKSARTLDAHAPLRFPIQTTRRKAWQKKKFNDSERNKRKVLNLNGNALYKLFYQADLHLVDAKVDAGGEEFPLTEQNCSLSRDKW